MSTAGKITEFQRRQAALLGFIESISAELDLRPLLTRIIRHACELIDADQGTIGLVDHDRNVIRTEAVYHMPPEEEGIEVAPGTGLAGEVVAARRPVIHDRYGNVPGPAPYAEAEDAVIGVPIWSGDELIGFFGLGISADPGLGNRPRRTFTEADAETLEIFTRHAAIAIENARRYEREQRRTERIELIARMGRLMTTHVPMSELLQTVAEAIHEQLGYPNVAVGLLDNDEPVTIVVYGLAGEWGEALGREFGYPENEIRFPITVGITGAAIRERRVVRVNDVAEDPRYVPAPGVPNIRANLAIPIQQSGEVLGALNLESEAPFSDEDVYSLQIVADQLAIAIENARLYERGQRLATLEERNRLARELHDSVTQQLFGLTLITQSLESAWERDPEEGAKRTRRVLELSQTALAEMRGLLGELRPRRDADTGVPDDSTRTDSGDMRVTRDGLVAALRAYLEEVEASAGIGVAVDARDYETLSPVVELALFRIAQEAFHNALKHANASRFEVALTCDPDQVRMRLEDDGSGFVVDEVRIGVEAGGHGLGLNTMRERARVWGGAIEIDSEPGSGTRIEVSIPREEA